MWLEIEYMPTSLFSLKSSSATSSGGKTLVSPSPYSVKMALFNAIITFDSLEEAKTNFELIKNLEMQFRLSDKFVVNNCMIKILKIKHSSLYSPEDPFQSTVAFREYIYFNDNIKIALKIDDLLEKDVCFLQKWFAHINYFGKKGCFFQFVGSREIPEISSNEYSGILQGNLEPGILKTMDDIDKEATFDNINNYSSQKAKRTQKVYKFPYFQEQSSREYHCYERLS